MFIQTERTPNPATVKFLPGRILTEGAPVDCPTPEAAEAASPLAERLFQLPEVNGVMIGRDFVAVTKTDAAAWEILNLQILGVLMEHLSHGHAILRNAPAAVKSPQGYDNTTGGKIRELIETRVRPAVARDGGDIIFDRFEDGVVYLRMKGACAGCPSATLTLKKGVENMLKTYVPEVRSVQQVS